MCSDQPTGCTAQQISGVLHTCPFAWATVCQEECAPTCRCHMYPRGQFCDPQKEDLARSPHARFGEKWAVLSSGVFWMGPGVGRRMNPIGQGEQRLVDAMIVKRGRGQQTHHGNRKLQRMLKHTNNTPHTITICSLSNSQLLDFLNNNSSLSRKGYFIEVLVVSDGVPMPQSSWECVFEALPHPEYLDSMLNTPIRTVTCPWPWGPGGHVLRSVLHNPLRQFLHRMETHLH